MGQFGAQGAQAASVQLHDVCPVGDEENLRPVGRPRHLEDGPKEATGIAAPRFTQVGAV